MKFHSCVCAFLLFCILCVSACQQVSPEILPSASPQPTITPTFSPSPTNTIEVKPCLEKSGHIEERNFQSDLLDSEFYLKVYIPPCYDSDTKNFYPVLYLLHGQSSNDDQWQRLGAVSEAELLITEKQRLPFIMVMPHEDDSLQLSEESKFGDALIEELIPWVDKNYRTCTAKICRGIAGISRGAAWAMHDGLLHPELFENVAAHSLAPFGWDSKALINSLKNIEFSSVPRIWMDSGWSDLFLPQARILEEALTKNQIPHEFYVYAGYHDEKYWQAHMEEYISWSTRPWK